MSDIKKYLDFAGLDTFWNHAKSYIDGKPAVTQMIASSSSPVTIDPNIYYKWGEIRSLSITLKAGSNDICNEYMFEFISGSTPTTLSLPSNIKWISEPSIEPNKIYQVSILNNIGVIVGWDR